MAGPSQQLRWGTERRLEFIEFRLFWEGGLNRSDLTGYFGVSVPQASSDLTQYQQVAPGNTRYDKSLKRYVATESFEPKFLHPDAGRYLTQLTSMASGVLTESETWLADAPPYAVVPLPQRVVDPTILRRLLATVREHRSIEIKYQSLNERKPKAEWRRITPHAFCFDGLRWHARAFCHQRNTFRDFLLPRILDVRAEGEPAAGALADGPWQEIFGLSVKPHPRLSVDAQAVVARDYNMTRGVLVIEVRLAMLFYLLKRLGLDDNAEGRDPQQQHIVLADPESVRFALRRADVVTNLQGVA